MTAEVIEGTVVGESRDDDIDRRLAVLAPSQSVQIGLGAVAAMSDEQFEHNLELLKKGVERAKKIQQAILEDGVDYGTEPGISRPFLHKPGAEKFEKAYGFAIEYAVERKVGDGEKTPELEYIVHAKVHLSNTEGPVIAEGLGSCNTHESKYRYRLAKPTCPDCGKATVIKGKEDGRLRGKYWCATRDGGCGHTFEPDSDKGKALAEQPTGQVENENPYDLANTILKMARKRAGVDAILTATGTSGLFSQDADSPSVQGDARRQAATAASGGEAAGQGGSSLAGKDTATRLPAPGKFAEGVTEQSLGVGELIGKAFVEDGQRSSGEVRKQPDGTAFMGFRLMMPSGQKLSQVELRGDVADGVALATSHNPQRLNGLEMVLAGELFAIAWKKEGEDMPPFYRLVATAVRTAEWSVPTVDAAAAATPAAKPKRQTKAEKDAAAAAAELVANGAMGSADNEAEAIEDREAFVAAATGPGMSLDDFKAALKVRRIAQAYVESAARHMFQTTDIAALTDQQRLLLANDIGLNEEP